MASGPTAEIQVLLQDDFNSPVSPTTWDYNRFAAGTSFYGRTQQRQNLPDVSNGVAHLKLDSFNPTARTPGDSFVGSELISTQTFSVSAGGIAFEARARIVNATPGIVGGIFAFSDKGAGLHDEADFEALSNDVAAGRNREQTNIYGREPLGAGHPQFVPVADLTSFHTYRIEWFPDRVRWLIDNQLVREDTAHVPTGPMALHLNIWAPATDWSEAYSGGLTPAISAAGNTSYFFDIDYARVARLDPTKPDPLFDSTWYLQQYPDVAASGLDPYQHYLTSGWREGRDPNPYFHTAYYLNQNADVRAAGVNPLIHYESSGWREGRDPSYVFNDNKYLATYPDVANAKIDPLAHYIAAGLNEGRMRFIAVPHGSGQQDPLVDNAYYFSTYPDVATAGINPFTHYDLNGWHEGRNPDALFVTSFYLQRNPDVAAAGIDPLRHYEIDGWKEGRDPSSQFSTNKYLAANPDVRAAGINPLVHYETFGIREGRQIFQA